jgi:hypothetical protein
MFSSIFLVIAVNFIFPHFGSRFSLPEGYFTQVKSVERQETSEGGENTLGTRKIFGKWQRHDPAWRLNKARRYLRVKYPPVQS